MAQSILALDHQIVHWKAIEHAMAARASQSFHIWQWNEGLTVQQNKFALTSLPLYNLAYAAVNLP